MTTQELMSLAKKHQAKADKAFQNYQETGMSRYDRERRNNEELADAIRIAANANDEHAMLINLRGEIAVRASQFRAALAADDIDRLRSTARSFVAYAEMMGIIGKE